MHLRCKYSGFELNFITVLNELTRTEDAYARPTGLTLVQLAKMPHMGLAIYKPRSTVLETLEYSGTVKVQSDEV